MSSGKILSDLVSFEINHGPKIWGRFTLYQLDGHEAAPEFYDDNSKNWGLTHTPDRIGMRMYVHSYNYPDQIESTTSIVVPKEYTMVLSHIFRAMADKMDEWYKDKNSIHTKEQYGVTYDY